MSIFHFSHKFELILISASTLNFFEYFVAEASTKVYRAVSRNLSQMFGMFFSFFISFLFALLHGQVRNGHVICN